MHAREHNSTPFADFGIIVALPEEFEALKEALKPFRNLRSQIARNFYGRFVPATVDRQTSEFFVVATHLNRMGQTDAGNAVKDLVVAWNPLHIILVGIAGGIDSDVSLSDVVVSSVILNYDTRKESAGGTLYRPEMIPASDLLLAKMTAFCTDAPIYRRWQKACARRSKVIPKAIMGIFGSGNALIADLKIQAIIKKIHDKTLAVEMEAAHAFAAAHNNVDAKRMIMVRGLSDHADPQKKETDKTGTWRKAASYNAARFVRDFITNCDIQSLRCNEFSFNLAMAPKVEMGFGRQDNCSYPYFDRLMEPYGPIIDLELTVTAFDAEEKPLRISRSVCSEVKGKHHPSPVISNNASDLCLRFDHCQPDYIALHLEIEGHVRKIVFSATSLKERKTITWTD